MFLNKIKYLRNTLFFRLTVLYTIALVFVSAISFIIIYYRIYAVTMERMDDELLDEIEWYVEEMAGNSLESVKAKIAEESESEDPEEEFYRLIDFNGNTLAATDMSSWGSVEKKSIVARLQDNEKNHIIQTITIPERDVEARMISAVIGPDTILQIGETLEEADEQLEIFRNLFAILIIILILLSATIGWFLARRALIGMQEVTQAAEDISKGSYDRRVQITGQLEEIKKLGHTFNYMLDRIQNLLKSMKEINDNIAHDLRSPLARIRGIAEMTLTDEKSIDDYRNMAVSTIEECDVLIDMINTMLDITEAEAGVNGAKDEEFDLVTLIDDACELFRPMVDEKKMALKVNLPDTLTFRGDKKKMQRIVTNILENSIKYSPEQGAVSVLAASDNGEVQIVIEDTGIGISETDLPHIFKRFYRCDRSRTQGGVGLGLSLAKAYTESMNGFISVNSSENQGSTFTLKFVQYPA
jgi:signal transduction histidine kinase